MSVVKLSEVIGALHQDDQLRKLAEESSVGAENAGGGKTKTQSPDGEMVGETIEDEKHQIQTKLMELAGLTNEGISAAKTEEQLNVAQKTPAGEKATSTSPAVSETAKAASALEIADVVGGVLGKMKAEHRKEACKKIVEKIASLNVLSMEDTADIKVAEAKFAEYDAAGRIMARSYYDEMGKLAEAAVEAEKKAAAETGTSILSESEVKLIDELTA